MKIIANLLLLLIFSSISTAQAIVMETSEQGIAVKLVFDGEKLLAGSNNVRIFLNDSSGNPLPDSNISLLYGMENGQNMNLRQVIKPQKQGDSYKGNLVTAIAGDWFIKLKIKSGDGEYSLIRMNFNITE